MTRAATSAWAEQAPGTVPESPTHPAVRSTPPPTPGFAGRKRMIADGGGRPLRWLSLALLLIGTAVIDLWNLSANGWANSFYSAAIQAGSKSWKAWFFGSSDMANSITVDKPPASLWIPGLSVRIFGLNPWAILVPEALMGIASVALLYAITRRYFGHAAGLLAGAVLAVTPVAAMMFRFDNPEALLILLMIAAVWTCLRAVETGRLRWMLLTGVLVGFGFLAKQMEVMLIVPPLAVTYLAFGPRGWARRIGHLVGALGALIVSAGWWILAVELWPASSRPWIGGSQHNSILELTLGYNGFGRLNGQERGSVTPGRGAAGELAGAPPGGFGGAGGHGGFGGGRPGGGMGGDTGWLRMFVPEQGGQIAWLIPAALIVAVMAFVLLGRRHRTDLRRAYLVVWGLWLLVMMAVFSFMAGIFHSYYTSALAPAVAATLAGGAAIGWVVRDRWWVRAVLAVAVWFTAVWGFVLLDRSPDFVGWLRYVVLAVGLAAGALMLFAHRAAVAVVALIGALIAGGAGPLAYTIDTIGSARSGSIISAGPDVVGSGPGGMHGFGRSHGQGQGRFGGSSGRGGLGRGGPGGGAGPMGPGPGGATGPMGPEPGGATGLMGGNPGGAHGAGGGLLMGSEPSARMVATLNAGADDYTWVAAAIGSNSASGYQLASGHSVMPIGGFNGTDPSPTLAEFQKLVAQHKIHYFIGGNRDRMGGGASESGTSAQITAWVEKYFPSRAVDGVSLYDLTSPQ